MAWDIVFFKAADGTVPAVDFLDGCPTAVEAKFESVLSAVAEAPPPSFSGGGKWEAMHGEMTGYFEARGRSWAGELPAVLRARKRSSRASWTGRCCCGRPQKGALHKAAACRLRGSPCARWGLSSNRPSFDRDVITQT